MKDHVTKHEVILEDLYSDSIHLTHEPGRGVGF